MVLERTVGAELLVCGIVGPKNNVAESWRFIGRREVACVMGMSFGRHGRVLLMRRRGTGEPASDEDDPEEVRIRRWVDEGNAIPAVRGRWALLAVRTL